MSLKKQCLREPKWSQVRKVYEDLAGLNRKLNAVCDHLAAPEGRSQQSLILRCASLKEFSIASLTGLA